MHDHVTVISYSLITIVVHQNLSTSVKLASFIQPRAVVCVSCAHTAVLSCRSVCITQRDEKCFAAPKQRIRREAVLLFIYSLYICTLLNMQYVITQTTPHHGDTGITGVTTH